MLTKSRTYVPETVVPIHREQDSAHRCLRLTYVTNYSVFGSVIENSQYIKKFLKCMRVVMIVGFKEELTAGPRSAAGGHPIGRPGRPAAPGAPPRTALAAAATLPPPHPPVLQPLGAPPPTWQPVCSQLGLH